MLRVRFAPSPTGYLHIGSARGLRWLALNWDEQYRQSERPGGDDRSHEGGPWLFNLGMRELTGEESDRRAASGEPFVLRFRVPRGRSYFADDFPVQPEALERLDQPGARELLHELAERLRRA